ncbi:MAG: hypothetical protein ACOCQR_03790 [bacterium]
MYNKKKSSDNCDLIESSNELIQKQNASVENSSDSSIFLTTITILNKIYDRRTRDNLFINTIWIFLGSVGFYLSIYGLMSHIQRQFYFGVLFILIFFGFFVSLTGSILRSIFYMIHFKYINNPPSIKKIFSIISFNRIVFVIFVPLILILINFNSLMAHYWIGASVILYELFNILGLNIISKVNIFIVTIVELIPFMFFILITSLIV